ncbi:hypothetical protein [Corynebacterium pilosum]|uniref:hypothetical protein n=1 Tax=Corynebacterium pilosum TaxID=35756 RepID=UPI00035E3CED|nr:hypothetical protein [Corynebacterium pilosum]
MQLVESNVEQGTSKLSPSPSTAFSRTEVDDALDVEDSSAVGSGELSEFVQPAVPRANAARATMSFFMVSSILDVEKFKLSSQKTLPQKLSSKSEFPVSTLGRRFRSAPLLLFDRI